jgi:hypothetical protein
MAEKRPQPTQTKIRVPGDKVAVTEAAAVGWQPFSSISLEKCLGNLGGFQAEKVEICGRLCLFVPTITGQVIIQVVDGGLAGEAQEEVQVEGVVEVGVEAASLPDGIGPHENGRLG